MVQYFNKCHCGRRKDARSKQCRWCHDQRPLKTKKCTRCGKTKNVLTEFRIRTRKHPRPRPACKACESLRMRNPNRKAYISEYRKRPGVKLRTRERHRIRKWGENTIRRLDQTRACELCQEVKPLVVDHCHHTGVVRGFLCTNCNTGLGKFDDSSERLQQAIRYLKRKRMKT